MFDVSRKRGRRVQSRWRKNIQEDSEVVVRRNVPPTGANFKGKGESGGAYWDYKTGKRKAEFSTQAPIAKTIGGDNRDCLTRQRQLKQLG